MSEVSDCDCSCERVEKLEQEIERLREERRVLAEIKARIEHEVGLAREAAEADAERLAAAGRLLAEQLETASGCELASVADADAAVDVWRKALAAHEEGRK